jgi:hypothetical protein
MRKYVLLLVALLSSPAVADDYSTMATFVMIANCMDQNGGQSEENLYMCSCRADRIQAEMSAGDYEDALTVERYRELPADKGAVFRDTKRAQQLYDRLKKVRRQAADACPAIRTVTAGPRPAQEK